MVIRYRGDAAQQHRYSARVWQPRVPVRAIVVVLHGGRPESPAPTRPWQGAVLRMLPFARRLRAELAPDGVAVCALRFAVRGWNAAPGPVRDAESLLQRLTERYGEQIPVVLLGHSMGGRVAMRVAGAVNVAGVVGLAPWLPPGEPVEQLRGRQIVLIHGTGDRRIPLRTSAEYADRGRPVCDGVRLVEVSGTGHAMLRRARYWHQTAVTASAEIIRSRLAKVSTNP